MQCDDILRQLDDLILNRSVLRHPFYIAWQRGDLTRSQLAIYARLYYPHVAAFPSYLRNAMALATDDATRRALQDNLDDELTKPKSHLELWLDFVQAMGADRHEVAQAEPSGRIGDAVAVFDRLTRRDISSGLTALYAYESQQPAVAAEKLRGLHAFYGLGWGADYFRVHAEVDIEHCAAEREAIRRCCEIASRADIVRQAADEALVAYWNLMNGISEATGVTAAINR